MNQPLDEAADRSSSGTPFPPGISSSPRGPVSSRALSDDLFTRFLIEIDSGAPAPDPGLCVAVCGRLRDLLMREMRRSALWNAPPSYLGVPAPRWTEEALEELVAECYVFIFVQRLRSLEAQLRIKSSIEGLVVRNVRNFLYDTQKKYDPLGFRIFDLVRTAILEALDSGSLLILEGDSRIRNDTVICSGVVGDRELTRGATVIPAGSAGFEGIVRTWNEELLPELVTARGRDTRPVVHRLRALIVDLCREIGGFRVKELIDPLKNDARQRWATLWDAGRETAPEDPEDPGSRWVTVVRPSDVYADRQHFARLVEQVDERLARLDANRRTRAYLERLWIFHRQFCAGHSHALPSRRELARRLDIPRYRLPELAARLGELVEESRRAVSKSGRDGV